MRLLLTRPLADSLALAGRLGGLGHSVVIDPMSTIRRIDAAIPDLSTITGLIFTSLNGVRGFAETSDRRDLPVYAVGARTAAAARTAGFDRVESADGDGDALLDLLRVRCRPGDGALLHAAGTVVARDLAGALRADGYDVQTLALYEAVPADVLTAASKQAITEGLLDGVLLFSPRTARHLANLSAAAGLTLAFARFDAYCLSPAVADALGGLRFRRIHVAARPTQSALLACLEGHEHG